MNTSGYKYSELVPVHKIIVRNNVNGKEELKVAKGLMPFGSQTGILEEDNLTPEIVDYLLSKKDAEGNPLHAGDFVKNKKEK